VQEAPGRQAQQGLAAVGRSVYKPNTPDL
jgi:hypothetical protein